MTARRARAAALVAVVLTATALTACSAPVLSPGPQSTEERDIAEVTEVSLETSGTLVVTTGDAATLTVTAGENILDRLTSDVSGDRLTLGASDLTGNVGSIEYRLALPHLDTVVIEGAGGVSGQVAAQGSFTVRIDGAGSVDLEQIDVDEVSATLSGTGNVRLVGTATSQDVTISGTGSYQGYDLATQTATVEVSGTGSAQVAASDTLDARISGTGSIRYQGSPQVTQDIDGLGRIEPR